MSIVEIGQPIIGHEVIAAETGIEKTGQIVLYGKHDLIITGDCLYGSSVRESPD